MKDYPTGSWSDLTLRPEAKLWRKQIFSYHMKEREFTVELFSSHDGSHYAIATPADRDTLIVYGSQVVTSEAQALSQAIRKVDRDLLHLEIEEIGEDRPDR